MSFALNHWAATNLMYLEFFDKVFSVKQTLINTQAMVYIFFSQISFELLDQVTKVNLLLLRPTTYYLIFQLLPSELKIKFWLFG